MSTENKTKIKQKQIREAIWGFLLGFCLFEKKSESKFKHNRSPNFPALICCLRVTFLFVFCYVEANTNKGKTN